MTVSVYSYTENNFCDMSYNQTECSALLDLAYATKYTNWNNSNGWLNGSSICNWFGVSCDSSHQHVVVLNLSNNNLIGSIPSSLSNLTYLNVIDFSGARDPENGNATGEMCLYQNNFNNTILPSNILTDLVYLTYFDVGCTLLGGTIPSNINKLINMKEFRIYGCLFNGTIPSTITELPKLEVLKLVRNPIIGTLPIWKTKNVNLKKLGLNFMALNGTIPDMFDMIPNVKHVVLDGNGFIGTIPISIGRLKHLEQLALNMNNLTGIIPESFCNYWNGKNETIDSWCNIGSDTKEKGTPYYAPYWWLLPISGNKYKCPLPKCCVGNAICNQSVQSHIQPCT
eukprot:544332_1